MVILVPLMVGSDRIPFQVPSIHDWKVIEKVFKDTIHLFILRS